MYKSKLDLVKEAAIEQALSSGYKPRQLFMEYLEKNPLSKGEKDTLIKQLDDSELTIQDLIGMYYILEVDNEIESETNQRLEIERLCTEIKLFNTTLANSFIKPLVEPFLTGVVVKDPSDTGVIKGKDDRVYAVVFADTMTSAICLYREKTFLNIMTAERLWLEDRDSSIFMTFDLGSYDIRNPDSLKEILSPFCSCEILSFSDIKQKDIEQLKQKHEHSFICIVECEIVSYNCSSTDVFHMIKLHPQLFQIGYVLVLREPIPSQMLVPMGA